MAKVYGSAAGLDGFRRDVNEEALYPIPEGVTVIEFDAASNPALVNALNTDWNSFAVVGGVLVRNGTPVTINADGTDESERKQARQQIAGLRDYLTRTSPTNAQTVAAVKALIRVVLYLVRRVMERELL